jgi:hypothetical protein
LAAGIGEEIQKLRHKREKRNCALLMRKERRNKKK